MLGFLVVIDLHRKLGAVSAGLHSNHLKPASIVFAESDWLFEFAPAIAVHCAVDVDCRHALAVDVEDPVDIFRVCYIGRTLVVNDEVIAFGPVVVLVDLETGICLFAWARSDGDYGIEPLFNDSLNDWPLKRVVVAASSVDEEDFKRLNFSRGSQRSQKSKSSEAKCCLLYTSDAADES